MDENNFQIMLQAVLDKIKSIANIKENIRAIEPKLPKIKLHGTLNKTEVKKELNNKLKSVNPKVKIDADTTLVEKKMEKLNQQKSNLTITPTVDNSQVVSGLKEAQKETKTLWERFTSGMFGINLIRMGIQEVTRAIRQAVVNVKELDAIKTNIQMVSGASNSGVNAMMSDYNSMAKDLSSTTKEVAEAANEFLRMGESVASTNELIKSSQVLSKVGMIESAESASYLISSLKGYKIAAENSMDVVSKLTGVDLEAAVSAGGLAEALSKCSNIANNSGVAMDRLIGYTAIVGETTQKSMSEVGNSFQALLSRMNNIKIGRFIDDETGESLSDTEAVLNKLGIQLRDTEDSYRSFDAVLDDVGSRWKDFSKVEQNAISVAIAGTRQRENFEALMNNWSNALKYAETAANSAGSALKRYGVYQDSIQAKTNELTAAIESLSTNVISEDLYSGIIEATTGVVEFIDKTNLLKGTLAGLVTMGVTKTIASIGAGFITAAKSTAQLTAAMALFDKGRSVANLKAIGAACKGLSDQQLKLVLSTKGLTDSQRLQILAGKGVAEQERRQILTTLGFAAAEDKATISTFSLKGAFNSLSTTIAMNPIMAIATVVSAVAIAFSIYKQHVVEADEATKEAIETFETISSEVETLENKLSELNDQIRELDPITDAEDIENLKAETEELNTQLAILKEKQRIAGVDADKAAQKSLGMTEASRYKTEERESAYGGVETGASYVTKDEELLNAIEAYDEYKAKVDEANDSLANMAETGEYTEKEWEEQEQIVSTYSDKMDDARAHANELAVSLDEQKQGLDGNTDASQTLLTKIDNVITKYDQWLNLINGTTEALEEQEEAEKEVTNESPDTFGAQLIASQEALDKFKSSVQSAKDAYTTLLSGNYSSSDLLDSIQTINQAVSDMGGSLNWEFINSQTDSLELLGDAIQHISQKYAESILSGAGIDINSEFGQMLADMIIQAFEAEAAFEGMNSQLDNLQSSYQTLTGILESYNETGYISLDNLQSLLTADENLIAMLEVENGQLVLNQAAYENLVAVQLLELKTKLSDAAASEIETLAKQKAEQATNQNADASQNAVAKLDAETQAFNRNTSAAIANAVAKAEESGVSEQEIQDIFNKYNEVWNAAVNNFSGDFDGFMGGAASKAGKKAGDAYVDAFEKELKKLQTLRDQGKITEKQYLDYLRKLYQKFFKDKKKYAEQYAKYEHEYLQGMKSLYESALSGITSMLDKQISAYEDSKSAAVESLEAQRDAAIEAKEAEKERYEQEIELINKQIAAKEKAIQKIRDEIEAMETANADRKMALNLQLDEYNLQRQLNQKTKLIYTEDGFKYDIDTFGLREARQKVEDDKLEIAIANKEKEIKLIEKEIGLLENRKSGINENIDLLDKQIDQINDYYDKLIADTEKYWDNLISGMQDYKSRWEELGEIEENAKLISTLKQLGIEVDDVLGMSEEAFSKFKDEYVGILADIYSGNDSMLSALSDTTGRSVDQMGSYLDSTQGYIDSLSGIGDSLDPLAESIGNVEESMGTLSTTASDADENLSNAAGSVDSVNSSLSETATTTDTVATNVGTVVDGLNQLPENGKVSGLAGEFETLATKIGEVAKALGIGEGEAVSTLFQAMNSLNDVTLGNEGEGIIGQFTLLKNAITDVIETIGSTEAQTVGSLMSAIAQLNSISLDESIIAQFTNLKTAIDSVTAAISGGGGESSEGSGSGGTSGSKGGKQGGSGSKGGKGSEGESGGGNSLTGAITEMGNKAKEVIGEPDAEGDGTVIGEFGSMETAVNDVRDAIGTEGSAGGEGGKSGSGGKGESDDTLVGSIEYLGDKTDEEMGESGGDGIIGRFEQFRDVIGEADEHVKSISDGLDNIDGKEVSCTIHVNIETSGGTGFTGSAQVLGSMNLNSATYNAQYQGKAHYEGTAEVTGDWGVKKGGTTLVGELGQELIVFPNGRFKTVGDNGAEFVDIPANSIVFNHLQTKELLSKGNIVGRGRALASGTALANGTSNNADDSIWTTLADGSRIRDLQPGDKMYDMVQKFDAYFKSIDGNLEKLVPNSFYERNREMNQLADQISYVSSVVNNNRNVPVTVNQNVTLNCPNLTNNSGVEYVQKQLGNLSLRARQEPLHDY